LRLLEPDKREKEKAAKKFVKKILVNDQNLTRKLLMQDLTKRTYLS